MRHFPIDVNKLRGIPINRHPGAFGCVRKHHTHEGIDLYGSEGDDVFAIEDCTVIINRRFTGDENSIWWLPTDAVLVANHKNGDFYVYGEIESNVKEDQILVAGAKIGKIVPVLHNGKLRKDIPGHSVNMLHLEKYTKEYRNFLSTWEGWTDPWAEWSVDSIRPDYLADPTPDLLEILKEQNIPINFLTM